MSGGLLTNKVYAPGKQTEYSANFDWKTKLGNVTSQTKDTAGLFEGTTGAYGTKEQTMGTGQVTMPQTNGFESMQYPSIYRETVLHKDDRGSYINPYAGYASKPYGRRLMYDQTHPRSMYATQWSSELADPNGPYSFPTTTGLEAEQPWNKNLEWTQEGETGQWPTEQWRTWTSVAQCPTYDGYSDQPQYDTYKTHVYYH